MSHYAMFKEHKTLYEMASLVNFSPLFLACYSSYLVTDLPQSSRGFFVEGDAGGTGRS